MPASTSTSVGDHTCFLTFVPNCYALEPNYVSTKSSCTLVLLQKIIDPSMSYRIAGYFRGGKFSRISRIGLNSRIFSP